MARYDMELRHLEMVDRHIAEGAERIVNQEALIAHLNKDGHDVVEAGRLLEVFKDLQEESINHRRLILKMLDEPEGRAAAR